MWLKGWTRLDLGPDGGPFEYSGNPKGCLHTTEGSTLAGAEAAYRSYPPHLGYDPLKRIKHQYVSLDRHSYAFKGWDSDNDRIYQVEIVGFARDTHNWPATVYQNIAEDVIKPLHDTVGVPLLSKRFYGEDAGFILASPTSHIRLNKDSLRRFTGWLGHQHIPAPDAHWDPGKFDIAKAFSFIQVPTLEGFLMSLTNAEQDELLAKVRQTHGYIKPPAAWAVQAGWVAKAFENLRTLDLIPIKTTLSELALVLGGQEFADRIESAVEEAIKDGVVKVDVTVKDDTTP